MRRKYAWEDWFSRPCTVLLRGIHYDCSQSTMVQSIRNNASMRKVRVRITDRNNHIIVEVLNDVLHSNKATVTSE